ncbi:MAG: hypothetical protein ACLFSQ_06040 [Candidatus Zixiibacteriota bacterium]
MKNSKHYIIPLIFFTISIVFALRVAPAVFTAQGIPVGEEKRFGIPLSVQNPHDDTLDFTVQILPPKDVRIEKLDGYDTLPDTNWFYFIGGNTLTIPPGETRGNEIAMSIPDDKSLYNQHYMVEAVIAPEQSSQFMVNMRVSYFIETESMAEPEIPPRGKVAIAPSIIEIENDSQTFMLYNNDSLPHDIELSLEIPGPDKQGINYENTRDYTWIENPSELFKIQKSLINIAASSKEKIKIEQKSEISGSREALLFIKGDFPTRFARILID